MAALITKKIFVDSRFASAQASASSIEYEIPGGIELGPRARCWVSEFTCVASWDTLEASTNSMLYVVEEEGATLRALQLATGPHDIDSLAAAMETALNDETKDEAMGTYTVERVSTGTGGSTFRRLKVSCTEGSFALPSDSGILTLFSLTSGPYSTNAFFTFPTGGEEAGEHFSTFVDLRRVHSIFLHSPSFGNYNCVGPRGVRTILAKIPVDVAYGGLLHWQTSGSEHDHADCGVRSLHTLRLELRDAAGKLLDLVGTHWSCTLLFDG